VLSAYTDGAATNIAPMATAKATKNIANAVLVFTSVFCMKLDEIASFYAFV
jgi:hypothetical protein